MMRTAILLAVALALTAVAAPASADPIYECVDQPRVDTRVCVLVTDDCITAGGHIGERVIIRGHCP